MLPGEPARGRARFDLGPFVAGIQNTLPAPWVVAFNERISSGRPWSTSCASASPRRTPRRCSRTTERRRRPASGSRASTSTSSRRGFPNLNIQDVTGLWAVRPSCREPEADPLPDRGHAIVGERAPLAQDRLPLILRKPSPFTNTNTRSSIAINRNLTNNPATNSQGSGTPRCCSATPPAARAASCSTSTTTPTRSTRVRPGRLEDQRAGHLNLGLRYEVYVPGHRGGEPAAELRPGGMKPRLRRRGRHHQAREQGDPLGQPGSAHRRRLGRHGDSKNVVRAGYGRSYFPVPYAAGNLLEQNVPNSISQNYSVETNPLVYTPDRVPRLSNPFPAIVPVQAAHDGRAERGQPARVRPRLLERDAAHGHLAGELRAPDHRTR